MFSYIYNAYKSLHTFVPTLKLKQARNILLDPSQHGKQQTYS